MHLKRPEEIRVMKTPRTVDIAVTARCNLRCAYCSHFSAPGDTEDLETEGRINRDDLQSVWLDHPELHRLRTRRFIPLSSFEFCSGCRFIDRCSGNCPALAFTLTGEENHPSPDACLKRFLEEGGTLPTEIPSHAA